MDRRSFLNFGRSGVLAQTPWESFCHGVQRTVKGKFKDISTPDSSFGTAEIWIERLEDICHLYAYANAYDVVIALSGCTNADLVYTRHLLIVHFSSRLNQIEAVGQQACLVQPSVRVGDLLALGYQQFARVPAELTIAQWFATPLYHDIRPYHTFLSGVERINVLFADGSQAILGGFGVNDRSALSVPILNRCIPHLFELLRDDAVEKMLASPYWPFDYRLDSLVKQFVDINLARVFQGHRGRLLWVQQWVIRKIPEDVLLFPEDALLHQKIKNVHNSINTASSTDTENSIDMESSRDTEDSIDTAKMAQINARVKGLFDPEGIFLFDDEALV